MPLAMLRLPFTRMRVSRDGTGFKWWLGARLGRDVTNTEIAEVLGVSLDSVRRYLEADNFPDYEQCGLLARHFGIDPIKLRVNFGVIDPDELREYARLLGIECTSVKQGKPKRQPRSDRPPN